MCCIFSNILIKVVFSRLQVTSSRSTVAKAALREQRPKIFQITNVLMTNPNPNRKDATKFHVHPGKYISLLSEMKF